MALVEKYRFTGTSQQGTAVTVRFFVEGATGPVETLDLDTDDPYFIEVGSPGDHLLTPVSETVVTLNLMASPDTVTLLESAPPGDVRVDIEEDGQLQMRLVMDPGYDGRQLARHGEYVLTATSGLGQLEAVPFPDVSDDATWSLMKILATALAPLAFDLAIETVDGWYPFHGSITGTRSMLEQVYVNRRRFATFDDTGAETSRMTCLEVIEEICALAGLNIRQDGGAWRLRQVPLLRTNPSGGFFYDKDGVFSSLSFYPNGIAQDWDEAELTQVGAPVVRMTRGARREAEVVYRHGQLGKALWLNPAMEPLPAALPGNIPPGWETSPAQSTIPEVTDAWNAPLAFREDTGRVWSWDLKVHRQEAPFDPVLAPPSWHGYQESGGVKIADLSQLTLSVAARVTGGKSNLAARSRWLPWALRLTDGFSSWWWDREAQQWVQQGQVLLNVETIPGPADRSVEIREDIKTFPTGTLEVVGAEVRLYPLVEDGLTPATQFPAPQNRSDWVASDYDRTFWDACELLLKNLQGDVLDAEDPAGRRYRLTDPGGRGRERLVLPERHVGTGPTLSHEGALLLWTGGAAPGTLATDWQEGATMSTPSGLTLEEHLLQEAMTVMGHTRTAYQVWLRSLTRVPLRSDQPMRIDGIPYWPVYYTRRGLHDEAGGIYVALTAGSVAGWTGAISVALGEAVGRFGGDLVDVNTAFFSLFNAVTFLADDVGPGVVTALPVSPPLEETLDNFAAGMRIGVAGLRGGFWTFTLREGALKGAQTLLVEDLDLGQAIIPAGSGVHPVTGDLLNIQTQTRQASYNLIIGDAVATLRRDYAQESVTTLEVTATSERLKAGTRLHIKRSSDGENIECWTYQHVPKGSRYLPVSSVDPVFDAQGVATNVTPVVVEATQGTGVVVSDLYRQSEGLQTADFFGQFVTRAEIGGLLEQTRRDFAEIDQLLDEVGQSFLDGEDGNPFLDFGREVRDVVPEHDDSIQLNSTSITQNANSISLLATEIRLGGKLARVDGRHAETITQLDVRFLDVDLQALDKLEVKDETGATVTLTVSGSVSRSTTNTSIPIQQVTLANAILDFAYVYAPTKSRFGAIGVEAGRIDQLAADVSANQSNIAALQLQADDNEARIDASVAGATRSIGTLTQAVNASVGSPITSIQMDLNVDLKSADRIHIYESASKLRWGLIVAADVSAGTNVTVPVQTNTSAQGAVGDTVLGGPVVALRIDMSGIVVAPGDMRSGNYSPGTSGWALFSDGSIEANDVTVRGLFEAGDFSNPSLGSLKTSIGSNGLRLDRHNGSTWERMASVTYGAIEVGVELGDLDPGETDTKTTINKDGLGLSVLTNVAQFDLVSMGAATNISEIVGGKLWTSSNYDLYVSASNDLILQGGSSITKIKIDSAGSLILVNLPTSAPATSGAVWNDGGTLKIVP